MGKRENSEEVNHLSGNNMRSTVPDTRQIQLGRIKDRGRIKKDGGRDQKSQADSIKDRGRVQKDREIGRAS